MTEQKKDSRPEDVVHVFDGIEEQNYPMPRWWVWMFYVTIAFSAVYMAWYHLPGSPGLSLDEEFKRSTGQTLAATNSEVLTVESALADKEKIAAGQKVYAENCASCHGPSGGGLVGPNLTDKHWIHGNSLTEVTKVVDKGFTAKGMPAWGNILGQSKVENVVRYIASLQGTQPAAPKSPEGKEGTLQ
jgi:cytochrome c oxidase cbb3-type subunit III